MALALWVLASAACGHSDKFVGTLNSVESGSGDQLVVTKDKNVYHNEELISGEGFASSAAMPAQTATLANGQLIVPPLAGLPSNIEIRGDQLVWHQSGKFNTYTKVR